MILTFDTTFFVLHYFSKELATLEKARKTLNECRKLGSRGLLPTIVPAEFYSQTHRRVGRDVAEKYFQEMSTSGLTILNLDLQTARQAAVFRRKYQEKAPWGNCIIAATALLNQSDLIVTEDPHFKLFKELKSRRLEELVF